jgi:hypothetical protein
VSAQPSSFHRPSQTTPARAFTEREARQYNKNHQQFLFVKNRLLNLLEFPNKAARVANGIHGLMNGQNLPVFRAHKWAARQLDYHGLEENSDQFMSRAFSALDCAEIKCGRQLFVIGRADGVTQMMTSYERDYLGEAVEWVLIQAKNSPDYAKNPAAAITDDLLWQAIQTCLPERQSAVRETSDGPSITDDSVIKAGWTRAETVISGNLERIEKAGGDPLRETELFCKRLIKMAQSRTFAKSMERERAKAEKKKERQAAFDGLIEVTDVSVWSGEYISDSFDEAKPSFKAQENSDTPRQFDPPTQAEMRENVRETAHIFASNEEAALTWAASGVPVIPLHTPDAEGSCSCKEGAKCKSPGKHPRTYTGLKEATTDITQILKWFRQNPDANVGGITGEVSGVLVVDVDPKSGGDLTLTDLIDAYGDEWLETRQVRTGSGGFHFFYEYPKGLDLRNTAGKIGPGIDTRANGGYVVLPSSLHTSGKHYELIDDARPRPLPEWLLERLTADKNKQPAKVVNFQERARTTSRGGVIPEGQRNQELFKIGCGIWGHGNAENLSDLHNQLLDISAARCAPALEDSEVAKIVGSIARYPRGIPIDEATVQGREAQ